MKTIPADKLIEHLRRHRDLILKISDEPDAELYACSVDDAIEIVEKMSEGESAERCG